MAETAKNSLRFGSKKAVSVPNKVTMNFAHHQSSIDPKRLLIGVIIIVAVVALALKFGVLDQIQKKVDAYDQLSAKQAQLAKNQTDLGEYGELSDQYGRYSYGWMNKNETGMVNRLSVLDLIEKQIMPAATIEDFAVNDNVLTLNIHGITLDRASQLVKELEMSELVESATVYSASAQTAAEASIFMSVILTKEAAK